MMKRVPVSDSGPANIGPALKRATAGGQKINPSPLFSGPIQRHSEEVVDLMTTPEQYVCNEIACFLTQASGVKRSEGETRDAQ